MTDDEILNIMYGHATGFTSSVHFPGDDAVIAFAREILDAAGYASMPVPEEQSENDAGYEGQFNNFVTQADEVLNQHKN